MRNYHLMAAMILLLTVFSTVRIIQASGFTFAFINITAEVQEEIFCEPLDFTLHLGLGETEEVKVFCTSEAELPIGLMFDADIKPSGGRVDFDFPDGDRFVIVGGETLAVPIRVTAGKSATPDTYKIEIEVERGDYDD